jgi:SpoVK/Ycf46/Vps4 family AAA+-type ATPase
VINRNGEVAGAASAAAEPADTAQAVNHERIALIGQLLERHFDALTKAYLAPVANVAMQAASPDPTNLCFRTVLEKNLPLAAHLAATSVALIPPGPERPSWLAREAQWAISFYKLHSLISLARVGSPHDEQGQYWIRQAVPILEDLWRSIEDRTRSAPARDDIITRIAQSAGQGNQAAEPALSWFVDWQERNAPCGAEFWTALRTATPSYQQPDQDVIDEERKSWRAFQRATREALTTAQATSGNAKTAQTATQNSQAPDNAVAAGNGAGAASAAAPAAVGAPPSPLDQAMAELNSLIGLSEVKQQVKSLADYLQLQAMRKQQGLKTPDIALHFVFHGPPGTGKTSVARLLGKILTALGLLPDGHVVETSRQDLVAGYIGQTAIKADAVIDKAIGGVLFIDEAYSLVPEESPWDFGREAIEVILKRMEDDRDRLVVIAAGYPAEMDRFMAANPGLGSRFTRTIDFPSYTPEELARILDRTVAANGYELSPAAEQAARQVIEEAWQRRTRTFGNARMIRTLTEEAIMRQATRLARSDLAALPARALSVLEPQDLPGYKGEVVSVEDVLAELSKLIGMEEVKRQLRSLAHFAAVQATRKEQGLTAPDIAKHLVFTGPPGTGKTTVARLVGQIYAALGMVASGHVIEASRQDLVGGYLGQTAIKTNKLIDRALGGILFIDEAYTLTGGGQQDFGQEAIDTLLKRMEDDRAAFAVIVAGYPAQMNAFLAANPGLASRFPRTIAFPDYTPGELAQILDAMVADRGYTMSDSSRQHSAALLEAAWERRDATFGNGRFIRNLVEAAILRQATRLSVRSADGTANGLAALRTDELCELTIDDIWGDPQ